MSSKDPSYAHFSIELTIVSGKQINQESNTTYWENHKMYISFEKCLIKVLTLQTRDQSIQVSNLANNLAIPEVITLARLHCSKNVQDVTADLRTHP